jgi:hypothetical protein
MFLGDLRVEEEKGADSSDETGEEQEKPLLASLISVHFVGWEA